MIECAFASETPKGTLCLYCNIPCIFSNGFDCRIMQKAVEEFDEILNNLNVANWSEEFMLGVVHKYGGNDD